LRKTKSRISKKFEDIQGANKKALIPFFTAGDPSAELTVKLMHLMVKAGADVIELGVPFSDPMADGPVIQRSSERALKKKIDLYQVLKFVKDFRNSDSITPVVLMGYANPIEVLGYAQFAILCKDAGVDGVLTVDYPPEEGIELNTQLRKHGIDSIYLLAPTSSAARMEAVARMAGGYVYYVSLKGVTGASHLDIDSVAQRIPKIRETVRLPVGVGFGIRDANTAKSVARVSDAVVIGSRIVEEIENSREDNIERNLYNLLSEIREAIDEC